ncbi:hypothetical protein FsymDg_1370 [Candidatus Protofrankia datiscae]|uniref:Uncharacterized protein n=1 Tax=Candidatus Protofrankia datiscae TaxID=2716812 RepID=F8B197_9ACTN|nr:hypothetical protein FsymDg_1370 [Candidatus Protofrankia datiscae]
MDSDLLRFSPIDRHWVPLTNRCNAVRDRKNSVEPLLSCNVQVRLNLILAKLSGPGLHLNECLPDTLASLHPNQTVRYVRLIRQDEGHLDKCIDLTGGRSEPRCDGSAELADRGYDSKECRGCASLLFLCATDSGYWKEPGGLPVLVNARRCYASPSR